jgi:DNA-binding response OmpR family regulator
VSVGKVLLIEDEHDYQLLLSEMFKGRFGVAVQPAYTVDEAEQWLTKEDFDIVVSDINLPGRNGVEVIEILLRLNKCVPLIFFTASDVSQRSLDRHGYPCVVINKKDHRDLMQITANFLSTP